MPTEAWNGLHLRPDTRELFTDVDMPGAMCGETLAERVNETCLFRRPGCPA
ncbi:hypothetical protein [Methylobacterium sp. E-045]|uniref:hypothetical protein n=1 Tax=Methylobacterium sp. E-045 TaxID=2836575 RepID=UPI001FBADB67|nr:hypothetical protein [Methylobacterium sp. E-045]MCJ2129049.1 hypothetical protein [Methylobacterium sp. E-045]